MSIDCAIGAIIKRAREAKGLSQEKLAEHSQVDRTYISVLERGLKSPTLKTFERIASALGELPEICWPLLVLWRAQPMGRPNGVFNIHRAKMFDAYNKQRTALISDPSPLIRLEQLIHRIIYNLLIENLQEIRGDYDEASFLFPFWQNYPPEERGRSPRGDQFPWIEVGEHSVGCKLARYLATKFQVREIGLPAGTDQRFLLRSDEIKRTVGFTDAAMLFVDIKSVGPRDDFDHTVLSPYQVSGDGRWKQPDKGVFNSIITATKGGHASHPFHCALPPLYVLSDGCVAPTVSIFVKPVYEMLSQHSSAARKAKLFGKLENKEEAGEVLTKTGKPVERIAPEAEKLYAIG